MTLEERKHLKKLIAATAMYFGQTIEDLVLEMYCDDLNDLNFSDVCAGYKAARLDTKTRTLPLPSKIREIVKPAQKLDDESAGLDVASRIIAAVSKFGWTNETEALESIGEIGRFIVAREGGWRNVCENLTTENLGITRAQWRDMAVASIERSRAGVLNTPPSFEEKKEITGDGLIPLAAIIQKTIALTSASDS
jgi:hypothetical protein